jgi:hypothetical protein
MTGKGRGVAEWEWGCESVPVRRGMAEEPKAVDLSIDIIRGMES